MGEPRRAGAISFYEELKEAHAKRDAVVPQCVDGSAARVGAAAAR